MTVVSCLHRLASVVTIQLFLFSHFYTINAHNNFTFRVLLLLVVPGKGVWRGK